MWGLGSAYLVCAVCVGATAAGASTPPAPTFAKTVVLQPVSGKVLIRPPGAAYFTQLVAARAEPVGTVVDTTAGRVELTSADPQRYKVQSGQFFEGRFQVEQPPSAGGLVSLVLRDVRARGSTCTGTAQAAAVSKRILGLLRGSAKGRFRTVGHFSAATVLGTKWGVRDRCDGTLTVVYEGAVAVQDFVLHKTVIVRTGQTYLAKAP